MENCRNSAPWNVIVVAAHVARDNRAARAALLAHAGSAEEAAEAYRRAIGLESDPAVRRFLQNQLAAITAD